MLDTEWFLSCYVNQLGLDSSVGYAAHLGGAAAGLLVGMTVLRNLKGAVKKSQKYWFSKWFIITTFFSH